MIFITAFFFLSPQLYPGFRRFRSGAGGFFFRKNANPSPFTQTGASVPSKAMKPTTTLLLMGLLLPGLVAAQRSIEVGTFFRAGYANLARTDALVHSTLAKPGAPFGNGFGAAGCEVFGRYQRALVALGVLGMGRNTRDAVGQPIDVSGSAYHLSLGWVCWQGPRHSVYPSIGPGLETVSITQPRSGGTTTRNFYRHSTDLALNANFALDAAPAGEAVTGRLMLGLRLGCFINWDRNRWQDSPGEGPVNPAAWRPSGFYATLTLGSGILFRK